MVDRRENNDRQTGNVLRRRTVAATAHAAAPAPAAAAAGEPNRWREFLQPAPVRQFQLVQTTRNRPEVNLVAARPLEEAEEDAMRRYLCEKIRYDFIIGFQYLDLIERGANGKFEEFRSEVQ